MFHSYPPHILSFYYNIKSIHLFLNILDIFVRTLYNVRTNLRKEVKSYMKEVKDKRVEIRLTKKEFNNLLKKIEVSDKKVTKTSILLNGLYNYCIEPSIDEEDEYIKLLEDTKNSILETLKIGENILKKSDASLISDFMNELDNCIFKRNRSSLINFIKKIEEFEKNKIKDKSLLTFFNFSYHFSKMREIEEICSEIENGLSQLIRLLDKILSMKK